MKIEEKNSGFISQLFTVRLCRHPGATNSLKLVAFFQIKDYVKIIKNGFKVSRIDKIFIL